MLKKPIYEKQQLYENYKDALKSLKDSKTKIKHCTGIKSDSPINKVKYFHVCNPSLPPCLVHDVLEEDVAFNLKLTNDRLIEMGWFSYDEINELIAKISIFS